jgi:hypothetical protein
MMNKEQAEAYLKWMAQRKTQHPKFVKLVKTIQEEEE